MPAITADTLTLPRLAEPVPGTGVERAVTSVTTGPAGTEGLGFPVRRAFAGVDLTLLDPFIHLDEMGAVDYGPGEPRGTDWHPHRGFETVTYMIDGTFEHQDSHGGGGLITDGATQWMTAGGGILHIETPPLALIRSGGLFHGLQLWVNLPSRSKMVEPRYQNLEPGQVRLLSSADGGALVRLVAGELAVVPQAEPVTGPGDTHTPITFAHATVAPGARLSVPWRADFNALAYVLDGSGRAGDAPVGPGQLAVFGPGDWLSLSNDGKAPLEVILLGGQPIREQLAWYGPFVMNTKAEVLQAMDDYQAGRLGTIPPGALQAYYG